LQTAAALASFFLAMATHPLVMKRAQQEIDTIAKAQNRLPTISDRSQLPYINALIKELYRWGVVAPLVIPHCSVEDDNHNGYLIPKGTIIIPNVW
jgi:cytochrome P450